MIIICSAKVDNNRLEYIYWKYSKIYPACEECLKKLNPKREGKY